MDKCDLKGEAISFSLTEAVMWNMKDKNRSQGKKKKTKFYFHFEYWWMANPYYSKLSKQEDSWGQLRINPV